MMRLASDSIRVDADGVIWIKTYAHTANPIWVRFEE